LKRNVLFGGPAKFGVYLAEQEIKLMDVYPLPAQLLRMLNRMRLLTSFLGKLAQTHFEVITQQHQTAGCGQ
jgi:hypothetical protein